MSSRLHEQLADDATAPDRAPAPSHTVRRTAGLSVALVAVFLGAAFLTFWALASDDTTVVTGPGVSAGRDPEGDIAARAPREPDGSLGRWSEPAVSALSAEEGSPTATWTGQSLLVLYAENGGSDDGVLGVMVDPGSGAADEISASPLKWRAHPATAWAGGELFVVGGGNGPGIVTAGAAFDPGTDSWRPIADPPGFVAGESSAHLSGPASVVDGRVFFWASALAYDPVSDQWSRLAPAPLKPRTGEAVVPVGGHVLVWGGCDPSVVDCAATPGSWLPDGAMLDVATGEWSRLPMAPLAPGPAATAVAVRDDAMVVALGSDPNQGPTFAAFDIESRAWRVLPNPPKLAPIGSSFTATDRSVVLVGDSVEQGIAAAFSLTRETWRGIAPTPAARSFHAAAWTGDRLILVGGFPDGAPLVLSDPQL